MSRSELLSGHSTELAACRAAALVDHYHRTYELVLRFWERRNQLFVVLASVLAGAACLTFLQDALIKLLEVLLINLTPLADSDFKGTVTANLPLAFKMLISLLVVTVFYLMANLYHRSGTIVNYYFYLARLEQEIRDDLDVTKRMIAFTREGSFYRSTGSRISSLLGWSYKLILAALLAAFFMQRFVLDWPDAMPHLTPGAADGLAGLGTWAKQNFLFVLDVLVVFPTFLMFWGYVRVTSAARARMAEIERALDAEGEFSPPRGAPEWYGRT